MKQYLDNISFFIFLKIDQLKVDLELPICVTETNVNFSDFVIFNLARQIKILIKMKFYTAEKVSKIITADLRQPTHEYTDEEFSESYDVDTVPMPCLLDEREELHLPEQIIDDTSLFAVNVTSDVSDQDQQSQIDDGESACSISFQL